MDQYVTLAEVAKALHVNPWRLGVLLRDAGVPMIRLSERRIRILQADVDAWMADHRMYAEIQADEEDADGNGE